MKYYFITYQAKTKYGINIWNEAIDISPMQFIRDNEEAETKAPHEGGYYEFRVLNTCEISKEEFNKWDGEF
jgi:hypothetical protein